MKKLPLLLLLMCSVLMILSCSTKKTATPLSVLSIADFALQEKIQNTHHRVLDSAWLSEVRMLREMDDNLHNQINYGQPNGIRLLAFTCCPCGSGCCSSCDTTMMESSMSFIATNQVTKVSLKSLSSEKSTSLTDKAVGELKLFQLDSSIPNGQYVLEFEKSGYPPFKIPMTVEGKKILLKREPGQK